MELKVWVEGVVRVVCGLSLETSCQDVVIALAQAIGQTGRYVLIQRLRGTERQLVADDCPLLLLARLGQLAAEVQFVMCRTGPSLSDEQPKDGSAPSRIRPLLPRFPEPDHNSKRREPKKALTFNLGPTTIPRRAPLKARSPRASPELRASSPSAPSLASLSGPSKDDVFRQVLQQSERLRDLEAQFQTLEREAGQWEWEGPLTAAAAPAPGQGEELDALERRLRQNEAELGHGDHWEEQLRVEMDKEQDMHRHLDQLFSSLDDYSYRLRDLQAHSAQLGQDVQQEAHRRSSRPATPQPEEEALEQLEEELHHRLLQREELDAVLTEVERKQEAAEARLQETFQEMEELNKELRQCNLQQFILQTGVPPPTPAHTDQPQHDPTHPRSTPSPYLCNAGILDEDLMDSIIAC